MVKLIKLSFIFAALLVFWVGCAGNKSNSSTESDSASGGISTGSASPEVEEAKQNADAAEWEAHRLREELSRTKESN